MGGHRARRRPDTHFSISFNHYIILIFFKLLNFYLTFLFGSCLFLLFLLIFFNLLSSLLSCKPYLPQPHSYPFFNLSCYCHPTYSTTNTFHFFIPSFLRLPFIGFTVIGHLYNISFDHRLTFVLAKWLVHFHILSGTVSAIS